MKYDLEDLGEVSKQSVMSSNRSDFRVQPVSVRKAARRKEKQILKAMRLW